MSDEQFTRGMQIRRSVLGNAHVDRAEANKSDFDADFQRMIVEFAWGTVWAGDEIDRTTRHLITIAILAALGKENELTLHLRSTINTGVTPTQLKAALHQVAVYAGIPAANTAFGIARKVLAAQAEEQKTEGKEG
jgi:4-carboxymuconolactone decarboxylase